MARKAPFPPSVFQMDGVVFMSELLRDKKLTGLKMASVVEFSMEAMAKRLEADDSKENQKKSEWASTRLPPINGKDNRSVLAVQKSLQSLDINKLHVRKEPFYPLNKLKERQKRVQGKRGTFYSDVLPAPVATHHSVSLSQSYPKASLKMSQASFVDRLNAQPPYEYRGRRNNHQSLSRLPLHVLAEKSKAGKEREDRSVSTGSDSKSSSEAPVVRPNPESHRAKATTKKRDPHKNNSSDYPIYYRNPNDSYAYSDVKKYIEDNELMSDEKHQSILTWTKKVDYFRSEFDAALDESIDHSDRIDAAGGLTLPVLAF